MLPRTGKDHERQSAASRISNFLELDLWIALKSVKMVQGNWDGEADRRVVWSAHQCFSTGASSTVLASPMLMKELPVQYSHSVQAVALENVNEDIVSLRQEQPGRPADNEAGRHRFLTEGA